jgi:hypothetical protein
LPSVAAKAQAITNSSGGSALKPWGNRLVPAPGLLFPHFVGRGYKPVGGGRIREGFGPLVPRPRADLAKAQYRRMGTPTSPFVDLEAMVSDVAQDAVQAISLGPKEAERLCAAAGLPTPRWTRRETPEPVLQNQTRQLTGKSLEDIITEDDVLSRRPYRCGICGGTFTTEEFNRLRHDARRSGRPDPFMADAPMHRGCTHT